MITPRESAKLISLSFPVIGRRTCRLHGLPVQHLAGRTGCKRPPCQYVAISYPIFLIEPPRTRSPFPLSNSLLSSAVIYIKNRVNRSWYQSDHFPNETLIPEDEKTRIRDVLVPILASSEPPVRQQLIPVLQRILQCDFPSQWPRYVEFTMELLNTNNPQSAHAGLQCLLALCRASRYKSTESQDRQHFDGIVETSFPRLLIICNELVNQEGDEAGEMLHLALKAYKHATWVRPAPPFSPAPFHPIGR